MRDTSRKNEKYIKAGTVMMGRLKKVQDRGETEKGGKKGGRQRGKDYWKKKKLNSLKGKKLN